jgi:hypothetical protein
MEMLYHFKGKENEHKTGETTVDLAQAHGK